MTQIILPELGEGVEKAVLACWHVSVGDAVTEEDDVAEVVTDKATFNVPAPGKGIVEEILFKAGDEVQIGQQLGSIKSL